jgi:hypothetical protein
MTIRKLILFSLFLAEIQLLSAIKPQFVCKANNPIFEACIDLKKTDRPIGVVNIKAVLVICDHYVTPENNGIAQSLRVDLGTMSQMLDILESRKIAKVQKTVLQGTKATMANIVNTLKSIQCGNDDIVLYYFSGHGLMEKGKTYMLTADEKNLGREEVASIINSKNARLNMLISDCCSNSIDGLSASRSISRSGQKIEAGEYDQIYKDLFLGYEGTMHLSAATEGEYAYSNNDYGGFFTYHLIKEGLIKKPVDNWAKIFTDAKDKTSQMFMRMPAEDRARLAQEGIKNQTAKAYSMPKSKSGNNNSYQPPANTQPPAKGSIKIFNYSQNDLSFFIDNNDPAKEWVESKVKVMSVDAGKSVTLNQGLATVGYEFEGEDYYFELEKGDYFWALDENGSLEIFIKDENIDESNFTSVAITDFNMLFSGDWEWDDAATGDVIVTSFDTETFLDSYPDEEDNQSGSWVVRKQEIEGTEYNFITFIYDDEGTPIVLDYLIEYDQEYPDQVHLIFISAFEGDEEIPYEEAEEFLEPSVMMYRIQ